MKNRCIIVAMLIGSFFALISMSAHAATCDVSGLQQKLGQYASIAESLVNPADKSIVLTAVSAYPEGSSPPIFTTQPDGQPQVQIPSKAAAFFLAGVDAIFQGNKLVAGWAFLEAARRNPQEPSFLNNVAFVLLDYELFNDAQMILECALSFKSDFTSANVNLGYALGNLGDHANAANHYLTTVINNPGNADYLYLAANEYAKIGFSDLARLLANMGKNVTSTYDFDALLNALPPAKPPITCGTPVPAVSANSAYINFLSDWNATRLNDYSIPLSNYEQKVLSPSLDNALAAKQPCESSRTSELSACRDACWGEPLCLAKCDCTIEPRILQCAITFASSSRGAYVSHAGYWNGLLAAWFVTEQNLLAQVQPQLVGNWQEVLACQVAESDRAATESFWLEAGAELAGSEGYVTLTRFNMSQSINQFCSGSISTWLFAGGPTVGLEPQWCLGPICFSYDVTSQTVGVSAAFILAGKLTKNLVTGKWGANFGMGGQFGVGPLSGGGALYLKFQKGKVGFEPKVTFGPGETGYYMGLERIDVPLGQYAPPIP